MRKFAVILMAMLIAGLLLLPTDPAASQDLVQRYRETAGQLAGAALADDQGWAKLTFLCDRIGHRLTGSAQLEQAVAWAAQRMRADGLQNVQTPTVMAPHWVRGTESATMILPRRMPLAMLGLGMSVGTPAEGITADVISVSSFDDLEQLPQSQVSGKIVLFDVPYDGYRDTVRYRSGGPSAAARKGAVAALVRSVGPVSLQTPHTGSTRYEEGVPPIPAAALTIEGASMITRLIREGNRVQIDLRMDAQRLEDTASANVIGEIVGRELPEQVVVMGGHLDSWDVGQGAHDDGAGCVAAWQAAVLIKQLGLQPRRTIRVVLFTNEENGLAGARAYRAMIGDQIADHVAAIEMDGGSEKPRGFGYGLPESSQSTARAALIEQIGKLLAIIEAGNMSQGGGGADIGPLMREGVPGFGLRTVGEHYFDWHHTEADTLDKIDPHHFRLNTAALAILAFVLADMPERL